MSALTKNPQPGDALTTFRGEKVTFLRWEGHRIVVQDAARQERTFYAAVCNVADPRLTQDDAA